MTSTLPSADLLPDAAAVAGRAQVRVEPLSTLAQVRAAAALQCEVWQTDTPPLTAEVLRAVEHAGGYVHGAYRGGDLVGVSAGFLGLAGGDPVLHSHVSGVRGPGRGTGLALKLHQREWALARGVRRISWTFDPLVRRNAWFNLAKLGATGVEYLVDFYGPMTDGVNAGEASDRLFTVWDLAAPTPGARDGGALLVPLPGDVEALRRADPAGATAERRRVRDALVPAFADGLRVTGVTADGALVLS